MSYHLYVIIHELSIHTVPYDQKIANILFSQVALYTADSELSGDTVLDIPYHLPTSPDHLSNHP